MQVTSAAGDVASAHGERRRERLAPAQMKMLDERVLLLTVCQYAV